jgi:hypothetical protein
MDPDFFEVVMGSDGRFRFVPVTEQPLLRSQSLLRKGRERLPGMAPWLKNKAKASSLVRREMGSVHEARAPQQKAFMGCIGCGRDASYLAPPAQIRTCSFPAYGSYLESLTAMLRLGQGWRIRGRGSHSFISWFI